MSEWCARGAEQPATAELVHGSAALERWPDSNRRAEGSDWHYCPHGVGEGSPVCRAPDRRVVPVLRVTLRQGRIQNPDEEFTWSTAVVTATIRFDFDSTAIRLQCDRHTTILRYDRPTCGLLHCGLNK